MEKMKSKIEKYQSHIEEGYCTASPEHGCGACLEAQDAGLIPDVDYDREAQEYMEQEMLNG